MIKSNNRDVVSSVNQVGVPQNRLVANMSCTAFNPYDSLNNRFHHSVFSSISSFQTASKLVNHLWIIDTGAIDHMVCSISFFTTIISTISKFVNDKS
jgi:uncharacterized membrane protein YccF (DUF307 family)